ncbi:MAG: hypothetical protein ACT4N4_00220 [Rhodospirillales bacterium]
MFGRRLKRHADHRPLNVQLRVTQLRQLFNSLDPAPFHEQDLDADAEEYIVSSVREHGPDRPVHIVIHLPAVEATAADVPQVEASIRHYFHYREEMARRELRRFLSDGRWRLAIGVLVLFLCLGVREVILGLSPGAVARVLAEGFLIGGWVAMWQPIQAYLHDWRPLHQTQRVLRRLSEARVEVKPEPPIIP